MSAAPAGERSRAAPENNGNGDRSGAGAELGLLVLALIWGVNFSVIKASLDQLDPLAFNALRFPLACGALLLGLRLFRGPLELPRPEDRGRVVALGLLGNAVYQLFFIYGLDRTRAGNAALLLATVPVWTTLFSTARKHERPTSRVWIGVVGTFLGMILVVSGGGAALRLGGATLTGDLLTVSAAVLWSIYTVGSRDLVVRYGSLPMTAWTLWAGTPVLVLLGAPALVGTDWAELTPLAWGGVVYAGLLAIGLAYLLWYRGVQRIGNTRTAVYSNLVPVVALLVAWAWLSEEPTGLQLAGAAVILGGLTLTRHHRPGREPGSPAETRVSPPRRPGDVGA